MVGRRNAPWADAGSPRYWIMVPSRSVAPLEAVSSTGTPSRTRIATTLLDPPRTQTMQIAKDREPQQQDLEIKDAHVIFGTVWEALEEEVGHSNLRFPKEIILLGGAPGAGKGTN